MSISPYSMQYTWHLNWRRIHPGSEKMTFIRCDSPKERKALSALADIGFLSSQQLLRLFGLARKQLKKMEKERKLHRHELIKKQGEQSPIIPIYTLGDAGAVITSLTNYKLNYWLPFTEEAIIQKLLFVELHAFFPEGKATPSPAPLTGGIQYKNKTFFVYVIRGDYQEFLRFLKWEEYQYNERYIIIAEKINHIKPLLLHLKDTKVRFTTDADLLNGHTLRDIIYATNDEGAIIKEKKFQK